MMERRDGRRPTGVVLWSVAVSMTCVFVARLLDDPYDNFGGPVIHFAMLGVSGIAAATAIILLVRRGRSRDPRS
jgi:hypothetical protein